MLLILVTPLIGAAGRPEDGFLFFISLLGFLCFILGILYLPDLLRNLIRKFRHRHGEEMLS